MVLAVLALLALGWDTAPPATAADTVIAAAGNIACQTNSPYYNAGLGIPTRCRQQHTSDLLVDSGLTAVLPLGDNQYCCGSLQSYLDSYELSWGRMRAISRPVAGDHDYDTPEAGGYFDYFNGQGAATGLAGDRGAGYYSFDLGDWHLVALNSNCQWVACSAGSAQEQWLRADLARDDNQCTLAYMHGSRFSSGGAGNRPELQPLWDALHDDGAEVVLSADTHNYERFAPQSAGGRADPSFGMRLFVVGTGGHSLSGVRSIKRNSEVRHTRGFGVLRLLLRRSSYAWRFESDSSSTFTDVGTGTCRGPRPRQRPAPRPRPQPKSNCTITGTARADVLRGTRGRDVICGRGGADRIYGGGGNDVILGGADADRIVGGDGRDRVYGDTGSDVLAGGRGNDVLLGGDGRDRLRGGGGRDRIFGEEGDDALRGASGNDVLLGGTGNDSIRAGAGRDTAYGNSGDDVISGQHGADRLVGNGGANRIYGGAGNDSLVSARSRRIGDVLDGGRGRDRASVDALDIVRAVERVLNRA